MNTTSFMDKQIMDLNLPGSSPSSTSTPNNDFTDLIKLRHHEQQHEEEDEDSSIHHTNGIKTEDIVPSYDFQPIRSLPDLSFSKPWNSDSNSKNYSSLDSFEPAKVTVEKDQSAVEASILLEIDQTMKKHMDNLHHVLEGVSARLTQLETRTHNLESSMDDLKVTVGNNHGITDGKLRLLENILHEVQTGVHDIKDKQDIVQAQLQLAKLQVSKTDQQSETQSSVVSDPVQQTSSVSASAPLQTQPYFPSSINLPQSIPVVSPPNAPPQQGLPPPGQLPNQFSQIPNPTVPQRDPYLQPPIQSQEIPNQQYQLPLTPQPHPQPGAPPHQQYQQTPHPQYSQPSPHLPQQQPPHSSGPHLPQQQPPHSSGPHLPQQQPPHSSGNPPQMQPSLGHHLEEPPYVSSHNYHPNLRQPPSQSPSGPPPPSQQYYGTPPQGYEPPSSRSGSNYSSGYGTLSGPAEPYRYRGPPQYGSKQPQLPTASVASSGGSGYPQLPTARPLPQAIPTASAVSGGSGSGSPGSGNRVSVDDVVDKVATMGFPRDHVRATVRKLTENGQSVDLNTVLDKLMNEGGEMQQQRGWFGR